MENDEDEIDDAAGGETVCLLTDASATGERLDSWLAKALPQQSRSHLKRLIDEGHVQIGRKRAKPSYKLSAREAVSIFIPNAVEMSAEPENIPIDILYEDDMLIVINKAAGMVVHPSPGHERGSLVNALLYHCKGLSGIGGVLRPGIVHRLDKDTSGVMVAAKNDVAHRALAAEFAERTAKKVYYAIAHGEPVPPSGTIEGRIGRHPRQRQHMALVQSGGRESVTDYSLLESFKWHSLIECRPRTGRTHQIRVHLASIRCPIICDPTYGRESSISRNELVGKGLGQAGAEGSAVIMSRHALHALRLAFNHPSTGERMEFEAPLPPDMDAALRLLRHGARATPE